MYKANLLLIDLDPARRLGRALQGILESSNSGVDLRLKYFEIWLPQSNSRDLINLLSEADPAVICLVLSIDRLEAAIALLKTILSSAPKVHVATIAETGEPNDLLRLLQAGAADFIVAPLREVDILSRILRLVDHAHSSRTMEHRIKEQLGLKQLIGESAAFVAEVKKIQTLARCDASVLISGETGTGKELCARAIHYLSPRCAKPFLPVNCGALPASLMENELFGHERGAFTGAAASQSGLVREAEGGTLFLDEVDAIPPLAQVKLLRFIQEKEYRPLGSTKTRKADVRVIAATNADLESAVQSGQLRRDLFYRLNTIPIKLPPLRERREDIPLLARAFLSKYGVRYGNQAATISSDAMQQLLLHDWPGNVRELEHIIEQAVILSEETAIKESEILLSHPSELSGRAPFKEAKAKVVEQFEKSYIQGLLVAFQGNITKAAQAANKNRRAFWQLIRKHQIDVQSFKTTA